MVHLISDANVSCKVVANERDTGRSDVGDESPIVGVDGVWPWSFDCIGWLSSNCCFDDGKCRCSDCSLFWLVHGVVFKRNRVLPCFLFLPSYRHSFP